MEENSERIGRREFLELLAAGGCGVVVTTGCATNPVSGERQFMLISESQERSVDRKMAPQQFSSDFGPVQDVELSAYVNRVGTEMGRLSHRPGMPYSFRALNAVIANAYTFPAGSVGISRGLLVAMENEAQLAGVLGHEVGHVASRHSAEKMSKGMLAQLAVAGVALYVEHEDEQYTNLALGLGAVGTGVLLAHYSREDEREADALGMEYMVKAGHNPQGMPQLMQALMSLKEKTPSMFELLFSTHPLTSERHATAEQQARLVYSGAMQRDVHRDRYMDHTASVRKIAGAIREMEQGQRTLIQKKYAESEEHLNAALKQAPDDYAGLMLMSRCLAGQKRDKDAEAYARQAKRVAPEEPQANLMLGSLAARGGKHVQAIRSFTAYNHTLPDNPEVVFMLGLSHERAGYRPQASAAYKRYLQLVPSGKQATYATQRLSTWQKVQ